MLADECWQTVLAQAAAAHQVGVVIREASDSAAPLGQLPQLLLLICCPLLFVLAAALTIDSLRLEDPAANELLAHGHNALLCQPKALHVLPKGRYLIQQAPTAVAIYCPLPVACHCAGGAYMDIDTGSFSSMLLNRYMAPASRPDTQSSRLPCQSRLIRDTSISLLQIFPQQSPCSNVQPPKPRFSTLGSLASHTHALTALTV